MKFIKVYESDLQKAYEIFQMFPQNENGFVNDTYGITFKSFVELVDLWKRQEKGIDLKEDYVPDTKYLLEDGGNYVGIFKLRHYLNDALRDGAGHLGYGISPNYRHQGYATKGILLILKECPKYQIKKLYMSCNKDNMFSLKAQQNAGAYIRKTTDSEYLTKITLP